MKNSSNRFTAIKDIFIDGYTFDYVNLDKSVLTYNKLIGALSKPLKLILFYGKPGTGKTFLLQKLYNDLRSKQPIVFLPRPFFDENQFLMHLYEEIFATKSPSFPTYEEFLNTYKEKVPKNLEKSTVTVLLDEAQLYPNDLIEKIRLMADTRMFKFLFTVHKTDKEDILAKGYFKTRIWESVNLEDSSQAEVQSYIEKKLLFHNKFEYISIFKNQYGFIFNITGGNLRTINKLLYKYVEICEYYEEKTPSIFTQKNIKRKLLEMASINIGLINA